MGGAMNYRIVEAQHRHIAVVARALPDYGPMTAHEALHTVFVASAYKRAALVDGQPVAVWGAVGDLMADDAEAWLALTPMARLHPHAVTRVARREVRTMLTNKAMLRASILCANARASRFAAILGFRPMPVEHADPDMMTMALIA